ncbi:MAG: anthranilate synthase subunit [Bacillales bacterium]|jgi:anthranilate synthase component 2|nr:anthranilate synthase subunit [Bacillales bacterium]
MILLIDNYDSFTFNLYQYLGELGETVTVRRNNKVTSDFILELNPKAIIISPGPGRPEDAGVCVEIIKKFYKFIPILGICLGHQAIGLAFGATISQAKYIMHGKNSLIKHSSDLLFKGIDTPCEVMRYHSLSINEVSIPHELTSTAKAVDDNEIMSIKHKNYPVFGLQFHPESIGTPSGKQILKNFLEIVGREKSNEEFFNSLI